MPQYMPAVNVEDSTQNAFVQDWLTAYFKHHEKSNDARDIAALEVVIECVQETYNYTEHVFSPHEICAVLTSHPTEPVDAYVWHSGGGIFLARVDLGRTSDVETYDGPHVLICDRHDIESKRGLVVGFYRTHDDEDGWPVPDDLTTRARYASRLEELHEIVMDAADTVRELQADAELADMAASEAAEDAADAESAR